jgi:hypothetical protein
MRLVIVPLLIAAGLLVVALLLPSKRDTSVAAWWTRVCYQVNFAARVVLALALLAGVIWFVVLPMFGWRSIWNGN